MYTIAVKRDFIAHHHLIGGDWGAENRPHAHHYRLEFEIQGEALDEHGYLVNITDVEKALDAMVRRYRDRMLNDLPEFEGLNPSIEHFCRILCHALAYVHSGDVQSVTVRLWENESAWAAYTIHHS